MFAVYKNMVFKLQYIPILYVSGTEGRDSEK